MIVLESFYVIDFKTLSKKKKKLKGFILLAQFDWQHLINQLVLSQCSSTCLAAEHWRPAVIMPALASAGQQVTDSETLPAPVSWEHLSVVNLLGRDVNKVTSAHWMDKSTRWSSVSFRSDAFKRSGWVLPSVRYLSWDGKSETKQGQSD